MSKIESKLVNVNMPSERIFAFLTDLNNIEKLLPPDKYSDWKSDGKSCSFKIQNAYFIGLSLESSTPNSSVVYASTQGTPFPFNLNVTLSENSGITSGQMICNAQMNPFLEMLVKGPLKNLFDYMADRLTTEIK